ncbi:MAG: Fe-S cluster assembly protein SufD [Kiritimatiellales bacterium]|nr:Fe-S cluster assembly protein SufD [Kiritimatiellales bacterium]
MSLDSIIERYRNRAVADEPAWLKAMRDAAIADFERLGFPTSKEELWRFTNVTPLAEQRFEAASNGWKTDVRDFQGLETVRIAFVNGIFSAEHSHLEALPDGATIQSLTAVLSEDPVRLQGRLGELADAGSNAFVAANTALFADGAYIELAEGVVLDAPIHLLFMAGDGDEPFAVHTRNLIVGGKNSRATVVEHYIGAAGIAYWTNAVTEVFADQGAQLDHYKIQQESGRAYHFQTLEVSQQAGSRFTNHAVTFGSVLGRDDIRCNLGGEAVESVCNGLYLLTDGQHFDTHTFIDHEKPNCNSHELYKGILNKKAHAVFCGRIMVRPDAQKTDAVQSNKNLLLSRGAKVNSLPQLEIYADDVKCTHGATIGELSDESLFYLQTRGISRGRARSLLTYAFANEVLDAMPCAAVKDYVEELMLAWLQSEAEA